MLVVADPNASNGDPSLREGAGLSDTSNGVTRARGSVGGRRQSGMARIRGWCALAVLIGVALWQTAAFLRDLAEHGLASPSGVALHDQRFGPARAALHDLPVVGYVSPFQPSELQADTLQATYFFRTQYSLAPTLVRNSRSESWMIADFVALAYARAVGLRPNGEMVIVRPDLFDDLSLVQDFGHGVRLYRRRQ